MVFRLLRFVWIPKVNVRLFLKVSLACLLTLSAYGQDLKPTADQTKQDLLETLTVTGPSDKGEPHLRFDLGSTKPALAVIKDFIGPNYGKWWIVFDTKANLILPDLKENPIASIKSIEAIPTKDHVVLQVVVDSNLRPVVIYDGNIWEVQFKSQPSPISKGASIQLPKSKQEGLTVSLEGPGKEVRFTDPHTGYVHVVMPTQEIGFCVNEAQVFPEFCIPETSQGIAFKLMKDDLVLQSTPNQVHITHPDGLAISMLQERDEVRTKAVPMGLFADAQDLDWVNRRQKVNEALLDLPHAQHGPGELEIAWLLLSYGQSGEALGYLTHLAQERPSIVDVPLFRMLRGVGYLLLNQLPDAEIHLLSCQEEPEVQIWLSLIKAFQHPEYFSSNPFLLTQLRVKFQLAKEMVKSYPKPLRIQMTTLILMAGIALRDLETISSFLEQESRPENISAGEVYDLARARILMSQNKPDAAFQILGELLERATSPIVRGIARFDYVTHRLQAKVMKEEDALPQLESLRTQWHGGWLGRQVAEYFVQMQMAKESNSSRKNNLMVTNSVQS